MDKPTFCCLSGETYAPVCAAGSSDPANCYAALKKECKVGDRMFTLPQCKDWCSTNKEECTVYLQGVCNNPANMNNGYCKSWCIKNPGMCDNAAQDWCNQYKDPFCDCIQSPIGRTKYNPLCTDGNCIQHGYATQSMVNARGGGCQIIDCSTYFDVKAGGNVNFDDINIEQRCGNEPPPTTSSSSDSSSGGIVEMLSKYKWYIIGGGAVLLLVIIVLKLII